MFGKEETEGEKPLRSRRSRSKSPEPQSRSTLNSPDVRQEATRVARTARIHALMVTGITKVTTVAQLTEWMPVVNEELRNFNDSKIDACNLEWQGISSDIVSTYVHPFHGWGRLCYKLHFHQFGSHDPDNLSRYNDVNVDNVLRQLFRWLTKDNSGWYALKIYPDIIYRIALETRSGIGLVLDEITQWTEDQKAVLNFDYKNSDDNCTTALALLMSWHFSGDTSWLDKHCAKVVNYMSIDALLQGKITKYAIDQSNDRRSSSIEMIGCDFLTFAFYQKRELTVKALMEKAPSLCSRASLKHVSFGETRMVTLLSYMKESMLQAEMKAQQDFFLRPLQIYNALISFDVCDNPTVLLPSSVAQLCSAYIGPLVIT